MSPASATGVPGAPAAHLPLSENLREVLRAEPPPGGLTLNTLFLWTEGRGIFLFIILLCLPFMAPVSLPGLSTPLGIVVLVLALRLARGRTPRLPAWIGEKPLPPRFNRVLNGSIRVLGWIERWLVRPRKTRWMTWRAAVWVNGLMLALMGFYLALPLAIPFTNFLPAYAIVFLALAMMEEDGLLIWLGHLASVGAMVYLALVADLALVVGLEWLRRAVEWLRSLS